MSIIIHFSEKFRNNRKDLTKAAVMLPIFCVLAACDTEGEYQQQDVSSNIAKTPRQIQLRALGNECNNSLEATLSVDGKTTQLTTGW